MQRDDEPPTGAQAAGPNPATVSEKLASLQLSDDSETQVTSFINSLSQGLNGPRFRKLLTYILKFVEYNGSEYETLKTEQLRFTEQANSTRNELSRILDMSQERLPQVAPGPRTSAMPAVATQPLQATMPSAPRGCGCAYRARATCRGIYISLPGRSSTIGLSGRSPAISLSGYGLYTIRLTGYR